MAHVPAPPPDPVLLKATIESYIAQYPEDQHVARLLQLVRTDKTYGITAQPFLITALSRTRNTSQVRELVAQLGRPELAVPDDQLVARDRSNSAELEKLQTTRGQAENTLVKETIRVALVNLMAYYYSAGDMHAFMKCSQRCREQCATPAHVAHWGFRCIHAHLYSHAGRSLAYVAQYVSRMEKDSENFDDNDWITFKTASIIVQLDKKQYSSVGRSAQQFRRTREALLNIPEGVSALIPVTDLLAIVTLCSLASFERRELYELAANADLKSLYEAAPELRQVLTCFCDADFARCLAILGKMLPQMRLDMVLGPHVGPLVGQIRQRALMQYVSPFATLDLRFMARAFNISDVEVERDVGTLIERGLIAARIDKANLVLYATHADMKTQAYRKAMEVGDAFVKDATLALRILSCQRNDVQVVAPRKARGGAAPAGGFAMSALAAMMM